MREPRKFSFKSDKFRQAILYIASASEDDPHFGAVKLNKILYFSDFAAYRRRGKPITGATYQNLREGPAPRQMLPIRREMILQGEISLEHRPYFTGVQQRVIARRTPDREIFEPGELEIIDEMITAMVSMTARVASDLSHMDLGWQSTKPGETIPYETAWLSAEPLPQEAEEYSHEVAARSGR